MPNTVYTASRDETSETEDRWLCAKSAARHLDVEPTTLSAWRSKGIGPEYSASMGRDPRYKLSTLNAFMEAGLVTNTIQAKQKRKKEQPSCPTLA